MIEETMLAALRLNVELERCECGCGDIVTFPNGERCCSNTLRKFELIHGRPYKPSKPCDSGACEHCEPEHGCKRANA